MVEYISMKDGESLSKISRREALREIGIKKNGEIIQPPKCIRCGGGCIEVDLGTKYLQCTECGHSSVMYSYKDTMFGRKR